MPTKHTRRKNLKQAPKRNNVNFLLSDKEKERIDAELVKLSGATGMTVKMGALAKHALLNNSRHRTIEARVRDLALSLHTGALGPDVMISDIAGRLDGILSEGSSS